jgi:transposase-like protein
MGTPRKQYNAAFKARVAVEACRNDKTLAQISSEYGVPAVQISRWKKELLDRASELFASGKNPVKTEEITSPLYQEIGRLKMELDWVKKKFRPGQA